MNIKKKGSAGTSSSGAASSMSSAVPAHVWDKEREKTLMYSCNQSWKAGLFTDIKIKVGDQVFSAHRLVLASLSDYFKPLFEHDSNTKGEITLHNMEAETFSMLLHYAYTGLISLTTETVQGVLIAADYLSIANVKSECEKYMAVNLDCDNICDAIQFARGYSLVILGQKAQQFLKDRLPEVSSTSGFSDLDPNYLASFLKDDNLVLRVKGKPLSSMAREKLILETVLEYLSRREETDPQVLRTVFETVRLVALPKSEVKKCFKNFKHLKKNEEIKKYLDLHEIAIKFLKQRGQDYSLTEPVGGEGATDVPDAWFRKRKLANYEILPGKAQYAAGGHIAPARGFPPFLYNDPELEIEQVEVWIRRWDGRPVIGGLAVTYRPNPSMDLDVDVEDPAPKRYAKGLCESREDGDYFCATFEPEEYVVKVLLSSGYLIDRLAFVTNTGRTLGPFGGTGGGDHTEVAPQASMAYLYDINCAEVETQGSLAIYNLMFRWIKLE
ncbi:hypothetical protein EGW08_005138 [Elysia chlorotica]|uniref:BTB domain-containing protein n=1 Tax=Elysia chlorotica TaxID=188477 RepID=A0A433TZR4_ELYCH|nr:hypothetical protein EGW08_005138 [Elysia chlorotica]